MERRKMDSRSLPVLALLLLITVPVKPCVSIRLLEERSNSNCNGDSNSSDDLISKACKHTEYYDICMSSLRSNPKSLTADLKGLAFISVDIGIAYANDTLSYAKKLRADVQDDGAYYAACLADCVSQYSDAIDDLRTSKKAIQQSSYATANTMLSAALTDSDTCEGGFKEKAGRYSSPLTKRNEYFQKLCSNSLAITNLVAV